MVIKFQILKSLVVEAVKSATYLKGQVDRQAQNATAAVVASESIGDEEVHERALTREFQTAMEKLKTIYVDYINPTAQTIGDNVIYYDDIQDDIVKFTLVVSRRYNGTLTDALARLSAKYAEDWMLYQWWTMTSNLKQAEVYAAALQVDEAQIRKCFILSAPVVPQLAYPTNLAVPADGSDISGGLSLEVDGEASLTYDLNEGALDDIEAHSDNPRMVEIHRSTKEKTFIIIPHYPGTTTIRLFSRHNEDISFSCKATIKEKTT